MINNDNGRSEAPWPVRLLLFAVISSAMAGGMGWGIRGQYGHESGAMIAGALVSLTLVLFFVPQVLSLAAARAAAMMTVGIGIGGTMTYGQTVGLTHDIELAGNWEALRWGMLGLFIKGGIWISFAGTFLGMGLGGVRYRPLEMLFLMLFLIGALFFGRWLLNSPFDPANKVLPAIYFSDSWYFEPDKIDLKPRPEIWGGLLVALAVLVLYVGIVRRDTLAIRMAIVGFIAGGLGFPGGQSVQAFHTWNLESFTTGSLSHYPIFKFINWWNMMETGFGLIFGAVIAFGLWLNRRHIAIGKSAPEVCLSPTVEVILVVVHTILLISSEFLRLPGAANIIGQYTNYGIIMCVLPLVGIVGGRLWPYLLILPVVVAPICGKQMRSLVYGDNALYSIPSGWMLFVMIPMGVCLIVSCWLISKSDSKPSARHFSAIALLVCTCMYLVFNTYFFQFAWPWKEWTVRTPNQTLFGLFAVGLVVAAISRGMLTRENSEGGSR
ncbi:MAG: hypothetical protein ABL921_00710 [Pirellula sp.]